MPIRTALVRLQRAESVRLRRDDRPRQPRLVGGIVTSAVSLHQPGRTLGPRPLTLPRTSPRALRADDASLVEEHDPPRLSAARAAHTAASTGDGCVDVVAVCARVSAGAIEGALSGSRRNAGRRWGRLQATARSLRIRCSVRADASVGRRYRGASVGWGETNLGRRAERVSTSEVSALRRAVHCVRVGGARYRFATAGSDRQGDEGHRRNQQRGAKHRGRAS